MIPNTCQQQIYFIVLMYFGCRSHTFESLLVLCKGSYLSIGLLCFLYITVLYRLFGLLFRKDLWYIEEMGKPKFKQHRQSKLKTSKSEGIFKFNGCITCRRECIKFIPVAVQQQLSMMKIQSSSYSTQSHFHPYGQTFLIGIELS